MENAEIHMFFRQWKKQNSTQNVKQENNGIWLFIVIETIPVPCLIEVI